MPRSNTRDTLARQWELLKMLPTRGSGRTVADLVVALDDLGYHTSRRTVERDLIALTAIFPITCNGETKPHRWLMTPNSSADLPAITIAEALSLRMIQEVLDPLLPESVRESIEPRLEKARTILEQRKSRPHSESWFDKMRVIPPSLPLRPPVIDRNILNDTQTALLQGKQFEVEYGALGAEEPSTMTLHPLALVHRTPTTYLVATANEYDDPRIYALHRFRNVSILPNAARRPRDFNIDRYIEAGHFQFGNGHFLTLGAIVEPWLASHLEETPLANDQRVTYSRGLHKITATVADSWQLRWWILSLGPDIRVTKPARLKQEIGKRLRAAVAGYGG